MISLATVVYRSPATSLALLAAAVGLLLVARVRLALLLRTLRGLLLMMGLITAYQYWQEELAARRDRRRRAGRADPARHRADRDHVGG